MTQPTKRWLWWLLYVFFGAAVSPMLIVLYWIVGDKSLIGSARDLAHDWWNEAKCPPWKERPL